MDIPCFFHCAATPLNLLLGGATLIAMLAALFVYRLSRSYERRVQSLYLALGLLPLTITFILMNVDCATAMSCTPTVLLYAARGLLAAVGLISIAYYLFGSMICVKAIKGKPMSREAFPDVYQMLDEVCTKMNVRAPELYYIESSKPKAIAVSGSQNIIILSVGVFELLSKDEQKVVLAHEIAHLKNKHPLIRFVSRFVGVSYVYGFGLSQNLELEQERYANEVAEKVVDAKSLESALAKFMT